MRKFQQPSSENMDLLLDTLCDLLGTLVLIACLLVVTMQEDGTSQDVKPESASDIEAGILAEKKIEQARAELDGLEKLRAQLQSEDDPSTRPLITELQALKKTAELKRQERAKQDEFAAAKAEQIIRDAGQEMARLREQEQALEKKLGVMNKDTEAARQNQTAIQRKLADLQLELESVDQLKVEKLRLPRERAVNKTPSPIIVRHGQVYPLFDAQGHPAQGVKHVSTLDQNFTAVPQPGEGMMPVRDAKRLREFLPALASKNRYLTIYVYPDSYSTFRELKKIIFELGLDYGLDICTEHRVLIFNANGARPAPL